MKKKAASSEVVVDGLYQSVRKIIEQGRKAVSVAANAVLVRQNWAIGKLIVEDEQHGKRKADYGQRTLEALSARLTADYGNGFDARNLRYMRAFYLAFPIWNALRSELGWTHYRILMREADPIAREWYMNECIASGWSSRDLAARRRPRRLPLCRRGGEPRARLRRQERLPSRPQGPEPQGRAAGREGRHEGARQDKGAENPEKA